MTSITIGQNVVVNTTTGPVSGRVVGTEQRDASRHGSGQQPVPFVCVATDRNSPWRWLPLSQVRQ